jgi:hypothetical protein
MDEARVRTVVVMLQGRVLEGNYKLCIKGASNFNGIDFDACNGEIWI